MLMRKLSREYPKRGQIFIADLNPSFGREIHKKRPVLIISNDQINEIYPVVVVIPFSSIVPEFIGPDMVKFTGQKGLNKDSVLVVNQIISIDKDRLSKKVGRVSAVKLKQVEQSLKNVLGLDL